MREDRGTCPRSHDDLGFGLGLVLRAALLGSGELGRVLALDDLDRAARPLDRLASALRRTGDLQRELCLQLTLAEHANAVLAAASKASGLQRVMVEQALRI